MIGNTYKPRPKHVFRKVTPSLEYLNSTSLAYVPFHANTLPRCRQKLEKGNKIFNSDRVYGSSDHKGFSHWVHGHQKVVEGKMSHNR